MANKSNKYNPKYEKPNEQKKVKKYSKANNKTNKAWYCRKYWKYSGGLEGEVQAFFFSRKNKHYIFKGVTPFITKVCLLLLSMKLVQISENATKKSRLSWVTPLKTKYSH